MSANVIHERIARIARQVLSERFASVEDQAHAMAAAVVTELGLRPQWGASDPTLEGATDVPAGWYEHSDDCDAEVEARSMRDSYGGELFIRYATAWTTVETAPDPHAGELWANELERRQRQTAPGEWS